jgi:MFS transporter, DHA1 family, tetracycline resistance protein
MNPAQRRSALVTIVMTLTLDSLGFGILLPLLPQLLTNPASPHYLLSPATPRETGYLLLGLCIAAYPVMVIVSTPILGQLSDRYGRKPWLTISLAGTTLATALIGVAILTHDVALLFVARAFDGLTGGNRSIADAVIADITKPEDRTKTFGLAMGAFGTGLILGPFLGGTLADSQLVSWFDATTPMWFATALAAANTFFAAFLLTETRTPTKQPLQLAKNLKNLAKAYTHPKLRPIFLTSFLIMAGNGVFIAFFGAFLVHRYGWNERECGWFFGFQGVCVIFTQLVTLRRMAKRFAEGAVLRVTIVIVSALFFIYTAPIPAWAMFFVAPLVSTFNGLGIVNLQGLLSRSAGADEQGEVLGINSSVQALAMAAPPLLAGTVASAASPVAAIFGAAVLMFGAWLAFVALYRTPAA